LHDQVKRIVIIGPESTGKSTLTRQLAEGFGTTFADEYARAYLERLVRPYTESDLLAIAAGQLRLEEQAAATARNGLVFCDTDLYVLKVWSESRYGTCDESILRSIAVRRYDLYILTDIDMPWEEDPLREHPAPEMRQYFFHLYSDIVQQSGVPFVVVKGNEARRLERAAEAVKHLQQAEARRIIPGTFPSGDGECRLR